MRLSRLTSLAAAALTVFAPPARAAAPEPRLSPIGVYDTGLGASGAEIVSVRDQDAIAALTNVAGNVDLLDLSDPSSPALLRRVAIVPADTGAAGSPNSVAVHPQRDYVLVAVGTSGAVGAVAAYRISDGAFLAAAPAGIQPDSIAISPNGQWAVVANEAEGLEATRTNGGKGSLSIVDLSGFDRRRPSPLHVTPVALPSRC